MTPATILLSIKSNLNKLSIPDCRLAAGQRSTAHQGHPHRQPAEDLQHCLLPVQAIPAGEAAEANHLPRNRSQVTARAHVA